MEFFKNIFAQTEKPPTQEELYKKYNVNTPGALEEAIELEFQAELAARSNKGGVREASPLSETPNEVSQETSQTPSSAA